MSLRFKSELDLPPQLRDQVRRELESRVPRETNSTPKKPSKYRNEVVESEGMRFGSKWELRRWNELQQQQSAALITELRHHVVFALHVMTPTGDTVRVASYEADFTYRRGEQLVVEDTKSEPTRRKESYQLKAKHFEAEYSLRILEVLRARRPRRSRDG